MFKTRKKQPTLTTSEGCKGCGNALCRYRGASVTSQYNERFRGALNGCNTSKAAQAVVVVLAGYDNGEEE